MWTGDTYRKQSFQYILDNGISIKDRWCYQFGIFTGTSFIYTYELMRLLGMDCERILAFDSFEGLPEESAGVEKNPIWQKNEFSAKYVTGEGEASKIIKDIMAKLPDQDIPVDWYVGYFQDTLPHIVFEPRKPKPAFFVDFDVDLYISSKQIFDFMIPHGLIVKDTILGFDDFGGTAEGKGGESLALFEACEQYGMEVEEFHRHMNPPHVQTAYIVRSLKNG